MELVVEVGGVFFWRESLGLLRLFSKEDEGWEQGRKDRRRRKEKEKEG